MTQEVKECAEFFIRYFDFNMTFKSDWYISLMDANKNELAFIDYKHETIPPSFSSSIFGLLLNVEVDDVDAVYEVLKKDLANHIVLELKSEDYGQRHFTIEGPSKILIDVIQVIPPSKEYRENYE